MSREFGMDRKRKLDLDSGITRGDTGDANGSEFNYFTGNPYSSRYYDILEGRKGMAL